MLLALLCEMSPAATTSEKVDLRASLKALDEALKFDDAPIPGGSKHSSDGMDDRSESTARTYPTHSKASKSSMSFRSSFQTHQPALHASLLTVAQAKWAEDDPIPTTNVPLARTSQDVISLSCVLPKIRSHDWAAAQKSCISRISQLRREMPTISSLSNKSKDPHYAFSLSGDPDKGEPIVPPPLSIVSATVVPSESHLLLKRGKGKGDSSKGADQSLGSMATFFNPYDNKNQGKEPTLVAETEERKLTVEFANRLAVPLDVPSCQVEFNTSDTDRIKALALSFVIPPKAKKFPVNFPFLLTTSPAETKENKEERSGSNAFEVKGLRVTCLSRSYFIPIGKRVVETADLQVPEPVSVYHRRVEYDSKRIEETIIPRIEAVPAQPNLKLSFKGSGMDICDGATIQVHLADGEIFTLPSLHIQNDVGPSRLGTVERLQIVGVGLPGLPDKVLFDSDTLAAGDENEIVESNAQDWDNEMEKEGSTPIRMKALCSGLSLKNLNHGAKGRSDGSTVTFQIAAMHDMGNRVADGGGMRIRFRYRGVSDFSGAEIWRTREVNLKIVRVKGPRISSMSFRPDLSWGSAYPDLCMSFAQQTAEYDAIKRELYTTSDDSNAPKGDGKEPVVGDSRMLTRVGMDPGAHVSGSDVVVLMALANETDSTIILSNDKGLVGGFEGSPMPTMTVASGVSVKIPVVIPRIKRTSDNDGGTTDIVTKLISLTSLRWESVSNKTVGNSDTNKVRQGRIRIPPSCLREIIGNNLSFVSRICEPPVSVKLTSGRKDSERNLIVSPGIPVDVFVEVHTAGKGLLLINKLTFESIG
jgi:hypothetical protein